MTATTDPNAWMGQVQAQPAGDPLIVNKRYRLVDPTSGEPRDYTRVTTLLSSLGSSHGLATWTERGIIHGLALRPDLRSLLASAPGDKQVADEVLAAAKEAAGLYAARRHGTAVHGALEAHLLGRPVALDPDEPVARDLAAVVALIDGEGLRVRRVEQVVLHDTLGYAGRRDLIVAATLPDGRTVNRVADLKTGSDVGSGEKARKIEAQLAAYARATHVRLEDGSVVDAQVHELDVDTEVGYVIAVKDGAAELLEADLSSGWRDVLLAAKEHQRAAAARKIRMLPVGRRYVAPDPQILDDLRGALTASADATPIVEQAQTLDALRAALGGALERAVEPAAEERTATGRAKPRCSKCRQPGHRATSCTAANDVATPAAMHDAPPTSVEAVAEADRACSCSSPSWVVPLWSPRPDVTVCGACGWPSAATVERLRGERGGLVSVMAVPVRDVKADLTARIRAVESQQELTELWSTAVADGTWDQALHGPVAAARAQQVPAVPLPF